MRRRPLFKWIAPLNILSCDLWCPIQYYPSFPTVILVLKAGYLRVTHPFAMVLLPFDLHVLGMPPALILSQDQTLHKFMFCFLLFPFAHSNFELRLFVFSFVTFFFVVYSFQRPISSLSRFATPISYHLYFLLSTSNFTFFTCLTLSYKFSYNFRQNK